MDIHLLKENYFVEFLRGLFWPSAIFSFIPNCLEFTTPCLLADDTQIFAPTIDADVLADNINSDLENFVIGSS